MSNRIREITEAQHQIQNPLSEELLVLLGQISGMKEGMRVLDLACGKGESLVQWALSYGILGVGVESSQTFVEAAKNRAYLMDVGNRVDFVITDPAEYPESHHQFDIVSFLGLDGLGLELPMRLELMSAAMKQKGSLLLVAQRFWRETPPQDIAEELALSASPLFPLHELLAQFDAKGFELVEMIVPDQVSTDRYETARWMAVQNFVQENPDDRDAGFFLDWLGQRRRDYLRFERKYVGYGVFVLSPGADMQVTAGRGSGEVPNSPRAIDFDSEMIWVHLADGRIIGNPLDWYPWLQQADSHMKEQYDLFQTSIEWPELDQRIDIATMLRGRLYS